MHPTVICAVQFPRTSNGGGDVSELEHDFLENGSSLLDDMAVYLFFR